VLLFARRQLWIEPGGAKDAALVSMVDAMRAEPDGSILDGRRNRIGIVSWEPRAT
jgi:hypothetical protein